MNIEYNDDALCKSDEGGPDLEGQYEAQQYCAQRHVHAFTLVTAAVLGHAHLITGVSCDAFPTPDGSHYHQITGRTDWKETHYHGFCINSGSAIRISDTAHVHNFEGMTLMVAGHQHSFQATTLEAILLKEGT